MSANSKPTQDLTLSIGGMTCAACSARVEKSLNDVTGVVSAAVNLVLERADIKFDPGRTQAPNIIAAVKNAGYEAALLNPDKHPIEDGDVVRREGFAVFIAAALILPLITQMIAHSVGFAFHLSIWTELALATPVQFLLGARFYSGSFRALKAGAANMDVLVALGTSAAYFYSVTLIVRDPIAAAGHLYFEGSAVIITLVIAGKWLETRAKRGTTDAIRALMALRPEVARVLRGSVETQTPIKDVKVDDLVVIRPGEKIPTDGIITQGQSACDESMMTGESEPIDKGPGDRVIAGALNINGRLVVRTSATGHDTTLAKIVALVQSAQTGKAPVQRLVDRISAVFVPGIVFISALTCIAWLALGNSFEHALVAAISVLVIACPCALGLATPTALVAGLGAAAKAGILIKDIEALERIHGVRVVVFDKTGTLTTGTPSVTRIIHLARNENDNMMLAASVQNASEHPIAKAILKFAKGATLNPVDDFKNHAGHGVEGRVNGKHVLMGNESFLHSVGINVTVPTEIADQTIAILAVDHIPQAIFAIQDTLRPQSKAALAQLHLGGFETILLSGDRLSVARGVAQQLGIDVVKAQLRPDEKANEIGILQRVGKSVAMVGDGVNDAPALAAADVGIAMGSGTDVAMATAGITLLRPDPRLVPAAIDIGRATWRKIQENLFWAFVYNLIGVPLAALGLLTPAIAGAAMALSSVSVVTNSLRLKRWRPRLE